MASSTLGNEHSILTGGYCGQGRKVARRSFGLVEAAYSRSWSCPCVVTQVNEEEGTYRVRSLDNFKETGPLRIEGHPELAPSSLSEMRVCTAEEVREYLKKQARELEDALTSAKRAEDDAQGRLDGYIEKSEKILAEHGLQWGEE